MIRVNPKAIKENVTYGSAIIGLLAGGVVLAWALWQVYDNLHFYP